MATSLPSFFSVKARASSYSSYLKGCNIRRRLQVIKLHNRDEGRSSANMVDANINVLKKRIEMVKVKERLERCCTCQHGWNYIVPICDHNKTKGKKELESLIEMTGLICGTISFTCFSGTLFLCLVSLLVHFQL